MYTLIYYIVVLIASYFISQATAKRPQDQKPAAFSDFDFPQYDEGTPQCVFFGDNWTPDWMVLTYGNFRTKPIKRSGGK